MIIRRYFEVTGVGISLLDEALEDRAQLIKKVNAIAAEHGFDGVAVQHSFQQDHVTGLIKKPDSPAPDERFWKKAGTVEGGAYAWLPKRTSKERRELDDLILGTHIPGANSFLKIFGLDGWEIVEPHGHGLQFVRAGCGKVGNAWVVVVPEKETPNPEDEGDPGVFAGHDWLKEITLAKYRELQTKESARAERRGL